MDVRALCKLQGIKLLEGIDNLRMMLDMRGRDRRLIPVIFGFNKCFNVTLKH